MLNEDYDTYWSAEDGAETPSLMFNFTSAGNSSFNVILLQEYIPEGQCVSQHTVEVYSGGKWTSVATGTTIGNKRLHKLTTPMPVPSALRVTFVKTMYSYPPKITSFGLYFAKPIITDA